MDKWYKVYEVNFEEESDVRRLFNEVCGELNMVLPEFRSTRWRKKSDFYSLFLVFAEHRERLPLTGDSRSEAARILNKFSSEVDMWVRDERVKINALVREYGRAVQKAASDLGNRLTRHKMLEKLLSDVW